MREESAYLLDLEAGYRTRFTSVVRALPPGGAILASTLFYPTGGGQPCDQGRFRLPDARIVRVDAVESRSGTIVHRIRAQDLPRLSPGLTVEGEIDWERRYRHMRGHTGQHLLSALAFRLFGLRTERAHIGGAGGSFELVGPLPGPSSREELYARANEGFFTRPVRVSLRFVSPEELHREPGRSDSGRLPQGLDRIRLVEIAGADFAPCGGTHVRSTEEVGTVVDAGEVPLSTGGVRLEFRLKDPQRAAPSPTPPV